VINGLSKLRGLDPSAGRVGQDLFPSLPLRRGNGSLNHLTRIESHWAAATVEEAALKLVSDIIAILYD